MFLLISPMANIMIRDNVNESYVTYLGNIMNQFHKSKIIVIGLGAQISFDGFIGNRKSWVVAVINWLAFQILLRSTYIYKL